MNPCISDFLIIKICMTYERRLLETRRPVVKGNPNASEWVEDLTKIYMIVLFRRCIGRPQRGCSNVVLAGFDFV